MSARSELFQARYQDADTFGRAVDAYCSEVLTEAVTALPSEWGCAHGVSEDEPFCSEAEDEGHKCPKIRVHRDDAERFAALVGQVHELDRTLGEVIGERDRMHEVADSLAYAVAPIEVIGEHSSGNAPWQNALDLIAPAAKVEEMESELERLRARVAELENEDPWHRAVNGLNALVDAGIPFGIAPDGVIENPTGDRDEVIEWDTATKRWILTYEGCDRR